jgi:hypothetical protein
MLRYSSKTSVFGWQRLYIQIHVTIYEYNSPRIQTGSGAHTASCPMGTGDLTPGVKRPGRDADYSRPSSAEAKKVWSYTFTPQYIFKAGCLVKHRDYFSFILLSYNFFIFLQLHNFHTKSATKRRFTGDQFLLWNRWFYALWWIRLIPLSS